ncbi:MAG: hypothetical protein HPY75_05480 [Actinobacteria bacterium]|nr:hypothetical protein [Actinomycetota bacterium]
MSYRLEISAPESEEISIALSLDSPSSPLELELPGEHGGESTAGLTSYITDEKAYDASGNEVAVRREGDTWYVDHAGPLTFSYALHLGDDDAGASSPDSPSGEKSDWAYLPHLDGETAYLPGFAVFVRPRDASGLQPTLELILPEGWRAVTPWEDQPESMEDLLENPVYAGDITLIERESLLVASPSGAPASGVEGLEEYADRASSLLGRAEASLWGLGLPAGRRLLIVMAFGGGTGGEEEDGAIPVSALSGGAPFSGAITLTPSRDANPLSEATLEATAHGVASLLLSRGLLVEEEAEWLRAGGASYLRYLLPYDAGIWGAALFWDRFDRRYEAYLAARSEENGNLTLAGAAASARDSASAAALLESGGAVACAALDAGLRSFSQPYALDFAALLRNLREMGSASEPLTNDRIRSALESLTGRDWSSFFREYIAGSAPIPASAFSALNVTSPSSQPNDQATPEGNTSVSGWVLLAVAIFLVFLIPFLLEPYTMRPRKPGFLERELSKEE